MKRFSSLYLLAAIVVFVSVAACDFNIENPNAAAEDQVLTTPGGLQSLAIGMRREYSVNVLSSVVRASGLSAREFAVVVGFTNPQEIETGGTALPSENGILTGLWSGNYRVMGMAEQLIDNINVIPAGDTRNAFLATAHLFKAMTLGNLAQFYETLPTSVDRSGKGEFRPRREALEEAVRLLQDGIAVLGAVPSEVQTKVLGGADFDLRASMNAYLARYQNQLGNANEAADAADAALTSTTRSVFRYDDGNGNENPFYLQTTQEPATLRPIDNFGIDPTEYSVNPADGRISFFLAPLDAIGESSRIPVETMLGFYDEVSEPIPVYLPGEMHLIKAEASARSSALGPAITSLNAVLQKTDDLFGVNAGLGPYAGAETQEAVLLEVYFQRRIELFLTGQSLEDSRRFARPEPPSPASYTSFQRNRNYYPYPQTERDNNPNTPTNPAI